MIVVDTNIVAALYFPSTNNKIVEELKRVDASWIVPPLWRSEFRNVASLYYRKNLISFEEALEAISIAEDHLRDCEIPVNSQNVFDLIKSSPCSSYDCEFVVLAKEMLIFLITFDKQMLREFPNLAITPEAYIKKTQKKE